MIENWLTLEGYKKIATKIEDLMDKRPELIESIKAAREVPGEYNAEFDVLKVEVERIDESVSNLQYILDSSDIRNCTSSDKVSFGSIVELEFDKKGKTEEYKIVGTKETVYWDRPISILSPLAQVLLDGEEGEVVEYEIKSREVVAKIIKITCNKHFKKEK